MPGTCPFGWLRQKFLASIATTDFAERTIVTLDRHRAASAAPIFAIIPVCAVATAIVAIVVAVVTAIRTYPDAANRRINRKRFRRCRRNKGDAGNRDETGE